MRGELSRDELACRVVAALRDAARVRTELGGPGRDVGGLASGSSASRGAHVAARHEWLGQQRDDVEQNVTQG